MTNSDPRFSAGSAGRPLATIHEDEIERVALAIERQMFAPHELPLDAELHSKYRATAVAALMVMPIPVPQGALLSQIEAEARRYAGMYPEASDGRNTFVLFADYVARLAAAPADCPACFGDGYFPKEDLSGDTPCTSCRGTGIAAQPPAAPVETTEEIVQRIKEVCAQVADRAIDRFADNESRASMAEEIAASIRALIPAPTVSRCSADTEQSKALLELAHRIERCNPTHMVGAHTRPFLYRQDIEAIVSALRQVAGDVPQEAPKPLEPKAFESAIKDILEGWFGEAFEHMDEEKHRRRHLLDPLCKAACSVTRPPRGGES